MPPKRKGKGGAATNIVKADGKVAVAPPTKKEKAAQMKRLFEAAFEGHTETVLEILGLWQDLQFATQQRYLETQDHDGENAFQLAVRGGNVASTRMHDDGRSERCKYCATLLLTAMHQNIYTALKLHTWQTEKDRGLRFYGPDSRAPYQKAPAKLHINDPLPLVPATRTTTDGSSTSSSSSSSNQNQHAHLQWTALHEAAAMRDLNKAVALLEQGGDPLKTDAYGRTARTLALTGPKRVRSHAALPPPQKAAAPAPLTTETEPTEGNKPTAEAEPTAGSSSSSSSTSSSSSSQFPPLITPSSSGNDISGGALSADAPATSVVDTRLPAIDANGSSSQATGPAREGEGNLATAGGDSVQGGESSTGAEGDGVLPSEKQKTLEKLLRGGRTNDNDDDNEGGAENEEAEKEGAATGKFMAEMLLAASWLNVDEVLSEMAAEKRRQENKKRLDQAMRAAAASALREKLWRQEACAPNLGREIPEDDDKKNSKSKEGSGEGGVEAPAEPEAPQTAKSKKNKKVVFKVQPGSWVADAKCWVPSCVTWGQQVAELYGHTETSIAVGDVKLTARRLVVDPFQHLSSFHPGPWSRAVGHNTYLQFLTLSGMGLGDKGAAAFANAIVFNHKLEHLILEDNEIGDEGAKALSFGLTAHKQDYLRVLSLKGNQIGDDGATCLLFHAWTKRELLEDFEEKLKPAHALPFEKSDLLMINLERNKIDAVVQKRLESATEAVFILRSKEERAASLIQKLVNWFLKRCRFLHKDKAVRYVQHKVTTIWLPKCRFLRKVHDALVYRGIAASAMSLRVAASSAACTAYAYELPPPDSPRIPEAEPGSPLALKLEAEAAELAKNPALRRKAERAKQRRAAAREAYAQRAASELAHYVNEAYEWATEHAKDPEFKD